METVERGIECVRSGVESVSGCPQGARAGEDQRRPDVPGTAQLQVGGLQGCGRVTAPRAEGDRGVQEEEPASTETWCGKGCSDAANSRLIIAKCEAGERKNAWQGCLMCVLRWGFPRNT